MWCGCSMLTYSILSRLIRWPTLLVIDHISRVQWVTSAMHIYKVIVDDGEITLNIIIAYFLSFVFSCVQSSIRYIFYLFIIYNSRSDITLHIGTYMLWVNAHYPDKKQWYVVFNSIRKPTALYLTDIFVFIMWLISQLCLCLWGNICSYCVGHCCK